MFTGFASENTPAIQVWDFTGITTGTSRVALSNDCAPIQLFKTGGASSGINVYLPSAPIEGRQIKIINATYRSTRQSIAIWSNDASGSGASGPMLNIGPGQTLDLCYSKDFIFDPTRFADKQTGWVTLNQTSQNSLCFGSVVLGGGNNGTNAPRAAVIAGFNNAASNNQAVVVGGSSNTASGQNAAVVGGSSSTASGSDAVVVGGTVNQANASYAAVVGGQDNMASGQQTAVIGGISNLANAANSVVLAGNNNTANGERSVIIGGAQGTTRSIVGNFVIPASSSPISSAQGVQQLATILLGRQTTDATATRLASDQSAAGTTNQVILPNNSAYAFQGTCIANVTAGGTTSGWKFEGVIKRGANAASTVLVAAVTPTVIAQDVGAVTWVLAITADTTNGGIAVTVTGAAATTIRWVAKIETTEVTF